MTYTYEVTNTGNTPLAPVALVDDTPPCEDPHAGPDEPGNDDDTLDVGRDLDLLVHRADRRAPVVNTRRSPGPR